MGSTLVAQELKDREELGPLLWAAFDGFAGGFALIRAIREGDAVVDWQLLAANQFVRDRFLGQLPACGERIRSTDDSATGFGALQRAALATRVRQETAMLVDAPAGEAWRHVTVLPVAEDVWR